jgi:DNA-binding transcriptional regulator YiaG
MAPRAALYALKRELDGRTFAGDLAATRCEARRQTRVSGPMALAFEKALVAELARGEVGPEGSRFLRRAAGLQASRLAELFDVTPGTISRWENRKQTARTTRLRARGGARP